MNEERRRAIVELVKREGRVLVADLPRQYKTSQVTIRKDLEFLHEHGLLHRSHGGALPAREGALEDPTLREKEQLHRKENSISRPLPCVSQRRPSGRSRLGHDDYRHRPRTARVSQTDRYYQRGQYCGQLSNTAVDVILTGGTLRKNSFSLVGPIAEETLRHLNADLLFLGVDGFDVHYGLSTPNLLESKVNRVMIEVSRQRIAVCDSSKFGRRSLSLIGPTSSLHGVITDHAIPKSDLSALKKSGIEVTLV